MDRRENMHVDEGALLALLDDELEPEERRSVEAHVAGCAECAAGRDRLRFAARRAAVAFEAIDVPSPWQRMPDALRRAARAAPRSIEPERGRRLWPGRRAVGLAAGLTLLLAAGAYAVPGSPVRGWVDDGIESVAALLGLGDAREVEIGPSEVSVEPAGGAVRVSVRGATPTLRIVIALGDGPRAAASARRASFRVESGLIEVAEPAGELQVTLPRSAALATVIVDGAEVARVEDGRLLRTEAADASRAEIVVRD